MDFRGSIATVSGRPTLACEGVVDLASVPAFRDALQRLVALHSGTTAVVDLDGVTALDDCGLGLLLGAATLARENGGELILICSAGRIADRIQRTQLGEIVTVRRSAADVARP